MSENKYYWRADLDNYYAKDNYIWNIHDGRWTFGFLVDDYQEEFALTQTEMRGLIPKELWKLVRKEEIINE